MKRILITGAAGFIGFHVARALRARGDFAIGLDNFNAYYDVGLKRRRTQVLEREGVEVTEADIRNTAMLKELIERFQISHVAHLAAQAGVRHSLANPSDYVASNLEGFVSILEACRSSAGIKLIYASSSSVYGTNKKIPFCANDPTDHPTNLYGATKKANEVMAHAYHHLYGLPVTALRYFTVYGPWGRPDMAYFRFAECISKGNPIQVFGHGAMRRDFTYIDDIVDGTLAAIDLGADYEIFNLGGHCPVDVRVLIELLEKALQKKAVMELLPTQPGEVMQTHADIDRSCEVLGFCPKISLENGLVRFVDWFTSYKSCE